MSDAEDLARMLAHAIDEWGGCFDCCTDSGAAFDLLRPDDDPAALNGERIEAALLDLVSTARAEALAGFGWEYGFRDDRGRNYRLHDQEAGVDIPAVFTLTRRLFGPWEPVEP